MSVSTSQPDGAQMQIFVKLEKCITLTVASTDKVMKVAEMIEHRVGIKADHQSLVYGGCPLNKKRTLKFYNIKPLSTLHLTCALLGGGKKRKKKNFTTPKKTKHVLKKEPMAVLRAYHVDENGKIVRMRRECPNEDCGAGVFMANHADRQTCGKCGLTFVFDEPTSEDDEV